MVAEIRLKSGHTLYFYSNSSRDDAASCMEIDFLIAKSKISNTHNISPEEDRRCVSEGKDLEHPGECTQAREDYQESRTLFGSFSGPKRRETKQAP